MAKQSNYLFGSESDNARGSVECLGMMFPTEETRRAYFTERLREKLKDPEFRKIEGFPIGEDEDILALSDPPYYTACPNPFIQDILKECGEPYSQEENYRQEPFAADISEGRTDSIYTAHSYHTKVPPAAVAAYILHYTKPGDVVLDTFCGSGMTGVGGMLCSSPSIAERFKGTKGERHIILCDLSPAATLITSVYLSPPEPNSFDHAAQTLLNNADRDIGNLWTLKRDGKSYTVDFQVWAEIFSCPNCQTEIHTERHGEATENIGASNELPCPSCGSLVSKAPTKGSSAVRLERRLKTKFDKALQRPASLVPRMPLFAYVKAGKGRVRMDLLPQEVDQLVKYEAPSTEWFPTYPAVKGEEFQIKHCLASFGITHTHHFYFARQLATFSYLWHNALQEPHHKLRNALLFFLNSNALGTTLLNRYSPKHFSQVNRILSGTLYIPSVVSETSYRYSYGGKAERLVKAFQSLYPIRGRYNAITTQSSTDLSNMSDQSVDYVFTDPPFGRNIPYSELNQLWEAWIKLFSNREPEAIIDSTLKKDVFAYGIMMKRVFAEIYRVLKPGRWATVVFHNSHNAVWFAIQEAILASGLVVADVRTLDRQMETYKQSRQGIVKQDLVISAYKPQVALERMLQLNSGTEQSAWEFVKSHLSLLPVCVVRGNKVQLLPERQAYLLFDRMVSFHVQREVAVPLSAAEFYQGLKHRFPERDGMYFLPEQVTDYDMKRLQAASVDQLDLFVSDEKSAIQWVRQRIIEHPMTYQDLQPIYMQEAQRVWEKTEQPLELQVILQENLVKDDKGLWFVPDAQNELHLEQLRHRGLLKEFEHYLETKGKLKVVRTEALRAGFKEAWQKKDYTTIVLMAKRLPEAVIQEDQALLMYYDNASLLKGE